MPFLQAGMYSRGITPPTILFSSIEALAPLGRTKIHFDVAILTATAGLFDQLANAMRIGRDRFAIGDLRFAGVRVHFEFAEHPVANDFQMQFTHAGDNRLAGVFVGINLESRILFGQPLQSDAHLFLVQFRLRLNRH